MKNISIQQSFNKILKILKLKNLKQLALINRKKHDDWDSLSHLEIIFLLENNVKKKFQLRN